MSERGVPNVMREPSKRSDPFVQRIRIKIFYFLIYFICERFRNLGNFKRVGQPIAKKIRLPTRKKLRFTLKATKSGTMDQASKIATCR